MNFQVFIRVSLLIVIVYQLWTPSLCQTFEVFSKGSLYESFKVSIYFLLIEFGLESTQVSINLLNEMRHLDKPRNVYLYRVGVYEINIVCKI